MNLIVPALAELSAMLASPSAPAAPDRASATLPLLPEPEQRVGRRRGRFDSSHSDQIPPRFGWGTPGAGSPDRPPAVAPGASAR